MEGFDLMEKISGQAVPLSEIGDRVPILFRGRKRERSTCRVTEFEKSGYRVCRVHWVIASIASELKCVIAFIEFIGFIGFIVHSGTLLARHRGTLL